MTGFKMNPKPMQYHGAADPETAFFEKVEVLDNGCWWWKPTHRDRTGRPRYKQIDAGQWAWLYFKGEYDPKVDGERSHTCKTGKDCVNPDHMVLESHKANCNRGDLHFSKYSYKTSRNTKAGEL